MAVWDAWARAHDLTRTMFFERAAEALAATSVPKSTPTRPLRTRTDTGRKRPTTSPTGRKVAPIPKGAKR